MKQPLSAPIFDLLVALAQGPQHGYALMQRIAALRGGDYKPSTGIIYANLQRLVDWGWVEEVAAPAGSTDARRKHYRITQAGVSAAQVHTQSQQARYATASQVLKGASTC